MLYIEFHLYKVFLHTHVLTFYYVDFVEMFQKLNIINMVWFNWNYM